MCMKQEDEWGRSADVSFGNCPEAAYKQYRDYHDNEVDAEDMLFYELGSSKTATVTWHIA